MVDDLKIADPAHLCVYRTQKLIHRVFGITQFALRVAKQLDGHDIGISIGDASCHQRTGIRLDNGRTFEARNKVPHGKPKQYKPNRKWNEQQAV